MKIISRNNNKWAAKRSDSWIDGFRRFGRRVQEAINVVHILSLFAFVLYASIALIIEHAHRFSS